MTKSNIIFFECNESESIEIGAVISKRATLEGLPVRYVAEKLNTTNIETAKDAEIISVFVNSVVDKDAIDAMPNLRLIVTRSTGFDHIDHVYAKQKGIRVANVPSYGSRTVAEYTFSLILGLSRKTFTATHEIKNGGAFETAGYMGFDLQGKTIGVIGTGRIGQNVAMIARGFDMKILAYDAFPNIEKAATIGFDYVQLDELLSRSDIVTIHVPYNKSTHYLINKDNISKFKKGSLLINTARGEVCDTDAILAGVNEKILAGVALDVIEGERQLKDEDHLYGNSESSPSPSETRKLLEDHILMGLPEVYITPHIAFFTREAQREIIETSIGDIEAFLDGKDQNLV